MSIDLLITDDGLVAPLEQLPGFLVATIVVLGIRELEGLHGPGGRHRPGFDQQMHVIGHQHIGIAPEAIPLAVAFTALQIRVLIRVAMKEGCPAVAAGDHMIEGAWEFHPRFPCRGLTLAIHKSILMPDPLIHVLSQYSCLTPSFMSLDRNSPVPRQVDPPSQGKVVSISQVGGLHHRYTRAA